MEFQEAIKKVFAAPEMRYWMVYALIAQIGYFTGVLNSFGIFMTIIACVIGGWNIGNRIKNEKNLF